MEQYLINYLYEHADKPFISKYIDFLKLELDWFIYDYGEQLASTHSRKRKYSLKSRLLKELQKLSVLYGHFNVDENSKNILSCVASRAFMNSLLEMGYNPISTILQPVGLKQVIGSREILKLLNYKNEKISSGKFVDIYNEVFFEQIEACCHSLLSQCNKYNFHALFLYTDQYFESKMLLDVFKKINRPSFVFSHGLPGIYSLAVDNRSDYLMVWGEKIKHNYINAGFDKNKIYVVGNSKYDKVLIPRSLRNSYISDILIIPVSSSCIHQHDWHKPLLVDRSMIVLYLYSVQNVLQSLGVKHARFRPHPSIDKQWVYGFLDHDFYSMDVDNLNASLEKASLVIGATSSVFLEAIMNGVNYIVYEPHDGKDTLLRGALVPPFDGSDEKVQVAKNENELKYMLQNRYQVDSTILEDYMQPLDLSILNQLLK
ncbi:hypothetical protein [uncultured Bacteroides sp.]|uniref:hypothetical protein n=1 Tax=uncultured Bacteroides sp. TaxID=162156 RepID=UPI0025F25BDA|nr:hypothetical protein [uncultured Bacteroides sp.]